MIRNTRANAGVKLPPRRAETVLFEPEESERAFWEQWDGELRARLSAAQRQPVQPLGPFALANRRQQSGGLARRAGKVPRPRRCPRLARTGARWKKAGAGNAS